MRIPDFFIIGASRCGTTALSEYLAEHPNICFARSKEPHFFSDDFPLQKIDDNLVDYWRRNFSYFDPRMHWAIGEGSGTYYISDVAVANILKQNPTAKFIYMVRNPIEMVHSWHYHQQFGTGESFRLEEVWELQRTRSLEMRQQGGDVRFRRYREMASLGRRLQVLNSLIPSDQLMVIVFDDFISDTKTTYENVLAFIGVPSDGRESFPQINKSRAQRSRMLGHISASLPQWVYTGAREFKHIFGLNHVSLNLLFKLNSKPLTRPPLAPEFRKLLVKEFEPEVRLLERHLNRDLSDWRT